MVPVSYVVDGALGPAHGEVDDAHDPDEDQGEDHQADDDGAGARDPVDCCLE
jgi:hypothetical protein